MMLLLKAQDIHEIEIGLADDQSLFFHTRIEALPEAYLAAIDRALADQGVTKEQISQVSVVTGPGSFTSTRVITLITNAFAFARQIPVQGIENKDKKTMQQLFEHVNDSSEQQASSFVVPVYDRPPRITRPRS